MDLSNFKANSPRVAEILLGMAATEKGWKVARLNFTEYVINELRYQSWHIHDGWLQHNGTSGAILEHPELTLTWIREHGESHYHVCPKVDEILVITADVPPTSNLDEPRTIYCYKVIEKDVSWVSSPKLKLRLIDTKQIMYHTKFKTFTSYTLPVKSWFQKIFNK